MKSVLIAQCNDYRITIRAPSVFKLLPYKPRCHCAVGSAIRFELPGKINLDPLQSAFCLHYRLNEWINWCFFSVFFSIRPLLLITYIRCSYLLVRSKTQTVFSVSLFLFSEHASFFCLIFKVVLIFSSWKFENKCSESCVVGSCKAEKKWKWSVCLCDCGAKNNITWKCWLALKSCLFPLWISVVGSRLWVELGLELGKYFFQHSQHTSLHICVAKLFFSTVPPC